MSSRRGVRYQELRIPGHLWAPELPTCLCLTGLGVLLRNAVFIFTVTNVAGSILGRRQRLLVRPRSPSLKSTGSPLYFGAFFDVRPHVISGLQGSGHQFGRECRECPCYPTSKQLPRRPSLEVRVMGIRETWPAQRKIRLCGGTIKRPMALSLQNLKKTC